MNVKKKFNICYLHIGIEKTGSTTIQRYLEHNRDELLKQGHYYPKCLGPRRGSHYYLVVFCRHNDVFDDLRLTCGVTNVEELQNFREKLTFDMQEEFSSIGNTDILHISSENCHSRLLGTDSIGYVKELLSPWVEDFKIIVYLRPQHEVALSLYSTDMKLGGHAKNPFPEVDENNHYYNYYVMLKKWEEIFGKENLIVRRFGRDYFYKNDLIEDYLHITQVSKDNLTDIKKENESLSPDALDFLGELNKYLPRFIDNKPAHVRKNIAEVMESVFPGKGPSASREDCVKFYNLFTNSNIKVAQEYFGDNELFKINFEKYELANQKTSIDVNKAFMMFAEIWKSGRFIYEPKD